VKDEAASRALLLAQNGLLHKLRPIDFDSDRLTAIAAARALEATKVKHEIARFMTALGSDPAAKLDLSGGAS
jgi:hypothetical protein